MNEAVYGSVVTHDNFDLAIGAVAAGDAVLVISSQTKPLLINAKTIKKFKAAGYQVIKKDNDGRGFRVQQGRGTIYVFQGQLRVGAA